MILIILASGLSSRFKKKGFRLSKYRLPFLGKSILSHIKEMKGIDEIIVVYNTDDIDNKDIQINYNSLFDTKKITNIAIRNHKYGPVHSLKEIINIIDYDKSYVISYCDYVCSSFNDENFIDLEEKYDCCVLTYKGFHPHHIFSENLYGYIKLDKSGYAKDYKEKETFTDTKLNEECSAGLYIFKKGKDLIESINNVTKQKNKYLINNELYVSMLVKNMIENNKKVTCKRTKYFAQLGTPEDYEDHKVWVNNAMEIIKSNSFNKNTIELNSCFLMLVSGKGSRFLAAGYSTHKSLLEIDNKTIIEKAILALPRFRYYAFSVPENGEVLINNIKIICTKLNIIPILLKIKTPNKGQADSALSALNILKIDYKIGNSPIYIAPCDSIIKLDENSYNYLHEGINSVITSLENPFGRLTPKSYSYGASKITNNSSKKVLLDSIKVKDIYLDSNYTISYLSGAFTYKSINKLYDELSSKFTLIPLVNNEVYLDSFYSLIINEKKENIYAIITKVYSSLGTPLEYKSGLYWDSYIKHYLPTIQSLQVK